MPTFLQPLDLTGLELLNARLQNLATPPPATDGRVFFHTGLGRVGIAVSGSWVYLALTDDGVTIEDLDSVPDSATRLALTPAERVKIAAMLVDATKNQTDAHLLARGNHTGSQSADTITDGTSNKVFTAAEKTKLGGVATGATANAADSALRDRSTHTGSQSADTITNGTNNKVFTTAEQTKLGGIAAGATANATDALLRDRSTHTGTQPRSTISDFDAGVRTSRLDQMAAPTAGVALNNQRITGLGTPTAATDATTKAYVDGLIQGLDILPSVRAATTANITLSGAQTVDGVALVAGNRVLVKNQTTASANGVYVVAAGAWVRGVNADTGTDLTPGAFVFVEEGTTQKDTGWVLTTDGTIVIGTTALTFTQFSGAGSTEAGNGLTRSGNVLTVGAGTGISVSSTAVAIDTAVVVRKASAVLSTSATSYTVTHNLNTRLVQVSIYETTSGKEVETDVLVTGVNTISVTFAVAPTASFYTVSVQG